MGTHSYLDWLFNDTKTVEDHTFTMTIDPYAMACLPRSVASADTTVDKDEYFTIEEQAGIPEIIDVQVFNDACVKVFFADGTFEKATARKGDTFNFETGVSICIMKKVLSELTEDDGNSIYNRLVHHGIKVYEKQQAEKVKANAAKLAAKEAEKRKIAKAKARKARREARAAAMKSE